jgi:hypothetical protein
MPTAIQAGAQSGTGPAFPGDNDGTFKWPYTKVAWGTDAIAQTPVDLTHAMPIQPGTGATFAVTGTFWQATQPISAAALPLPVGASTETTLAALNTKTPALGQALAAAAVPVVLTAAQLTTLTATQSTLQAGSATVGKVGVVDPSPFSGNITAVDVATTTTGGAGGQSLVTGGPTLNSSVSAPLSGAASFTLSVLGTWVGTLTFEKSQDGATYVPVSLLPVGSSTPLATTTTNGVFHGSGAGYTMIRVRCTAFTSGNAAVVVQSGIGPGTVSAALIAGTAAIGSVTVTGTPAVQDSPATSGGLSKYHLVCLASTNANVVKASAGQVYCIKAFNITGTAAWLKFYDKATTPNPAADTVVDSVLIPANTSGAGVVVNMDKGASYASGIAIAVVLGISDTDNNAIAANAVALNISYK